MRHVAVAAALFAACLFAACEQPTEEKTEEPMDDTDSTGDDTLSSQPQLVYPDGKPEGL
jgi:hypothetical protein